MKKLSFSDIDVGDSIRYQTALMKVTEVSKVMGVHLEENCFGGTKTDIRVPIDFMTIEPCVRLPCEYGSWDMYWYPNRAKAVKLVDNGYAEYVRSIDNSVFFLEQEPAK